MKLKMVKSAKKGNSLKAQNLNESQMDQLRKRTHPLIIRHHQQHLTGHSRTPRRVRDLHPKVGFFLHDQLEVKLPPDHSRLLRGRKPYHRSGLSQRRNPVVHQILHPRLEPSQREVEALHNNVRPNQRLPGEAFQMAQKPQHKPKLVQPNLVPARQ